MVVGMPLGCSKEDDPDGSTTGSTTTLTGSSTTSTSQTTDSIYETSDTAPVDDCPETATDIEGPFYHGDAPVRNNLDLYGDKGTALTVSGRVLDTDCASIDSAVIEVWHADQKGAYDDSKEYRYRGQMAADAKGQYEFHTLVPGRYLNNGTYRPAHIHIKIWVKGVEVLTTQLYFAGDPYNKVDPWYQEAMELQWTKDKKGRWVASFDFHVTRLNG